MDVTVSNPVASFLLDGKKKPPELVASEQDLEQAQARLSGLESRLTDTQDLLAMPRSQRLDQCNMADLKAATWNKSVKFHSTLAAHLCIFGAAVGGTVAMFGFGLQGAPVLLSMAAAGPGLMYAYCKGMKHLVLPLKVDKAVKQALTQERDQLQQAIPASQARVQDAQNHLTSILHNHMTAPLAPPAAIAVDEAQVTIGGVRIRVRKKPEGS